MSRAEDFVNFEGVEPPEHLMQGLIEEIHNLMRDPKDLLHGLLD